MSSSPTAPKRRKIRKGTHSCWSCKRRKMKCIFDSLNSTCNGCRQRGSQCISQEYPESEIPSETSYNHSTTNGGRTSATPAEDDRRTDFGIPTPLSTHSETSRSLAYYNLFSHSVTEANRSTSTTEGKYEKLSQYLHESLPSRENIESICKASGHPSVLSHQMLTIPYSVLEQTGLQSLDALLEIPKPNHHPVLIARYMLQLSTFLQHLHPHLRKEIRGISDSPQAIMERLVDLAIKLVTTNDELLGSIEGLECVMIEGVYQANIGNLRRSWVAGRRAISIAQLMGLHRSDSRAHFKVLDSKTRYYPQVMWFRIVMLDRHLCLMLGLPQGTLDCSIVSDVALASENPLGRLERIHSSIASRILQRNEAKNYDPALARSLDLELQRAARSLPSRWWLAPDLDMTANDSQTLFWDIRRLAAQVLHYNLLNQLHLPIMLCSRFVVQRRSEYARITCANASREVLSRFIALRSFNRIAYTCRTIHFLALMAAMTLLLAHLNSNLSETENLLAHQYLSDRAMIEQVQEKMEEVNHLNSDALSAQSAELLRRLLLLEVETGDGHAETAGRVSVGWAGDGAASSDNDAVVSVHIPYFGIIKIASDGMSKEAPKSQDTATTNPAGAALGIERSNVASAETPLPEPHGRVSRFTKLDEVPVVIEDSVSPDASHYHAGASLNLSQEVLDPPWPFQGRQNADSSNSFVPYGEYPGLTAGVEDWAFQGVDMAFFESLLGNTNSENESRLDHGGSVVTE